MTYICDVCKTQMEEIPEKCPLCEALPEKIIPLTEESPTSIDINGDPSDILKILKGISIPDSDPYIEKTFLNVSKDKITNVVVSQGNDLLVYLELNNDYFKEVWGIGKIPLDMGVSLAKMKLLNNFEEGTLQADNETKRILYHSGERAKFADNLESPEHMTNSKEFIIAPSCLPDFDYGNFCLKFDGAEYKNAVVNISDFKILLDSTSDSNIEFYPLTLDTKELRAGVGDMMNPTNGAFDIEIPIIAEKSNLPDSKINVEAASIFKSIIKNLTGEVKIHIANESMPIWISAPITKNINKKDGEKVTQVTKEFGRIGYMIAPRSESNE